jgi:hypothetical protein
MFRRQTTNLLNGRRWFPHHSGSGLRRSSTALRSAAVAASVSVAAATATITVQQAIAGSLHNDASPSDPAAAISSKINPGEIAKVGGDDEELRLLVWGSNRFVCLSLSVILLFTEVHTLQRSGIISPGESDAVQIRTPAVASFLQDVALRDLAVHAAHAVCVDGRGDVYQWGDGFFGKESASGNRKPVLTLQGKVRPSHFRYKWGGTLS